VVYVGNRQIKRPSAAVVTSVTLSTFDEIPPTFTTCGKQNELPVYRNCQPCIVPAASVLRQLVIRKRRFNGSGVPIHARDGSAAAGNETIPKVWDINVIPRRALEMVMKYTLAASWRGLHTT
jgi:hypothetical protein